MPRPPKAEQRDLFLEIRSAAWQQIAAKGAAALSLRGIARTLGITAPAIYNYYPSRDDLVTALIVEAFTSFAAALEKALEGVPAGAHRGRLWALGLAYRDWGIAYPQRYLLIFGTPLPGYEAPEAVTSPAAARALDVLVHVLAAAQQARQLRLDPALVPSPEVSAMLSAWRKARAASVHPEVLALALSIWGQVHGLVMLELGNQFPPDITNPGALYEREVERLIQAHMPSD
jgi:AcrR family transcriptional regulator